MHKPLPDFSYITGRYQRRANTAQLVCCLGKSNSSSPHRITVFRHRPGRSFHSKDFYSKRVNKVESTRSPWGLLADYRFCSVDCCLRAPKLFLQKRCCFVGLPLLHCRPPLCSVTKYLQPRLLWHSWFAAPAMDWSDFSKSWFWQLIMESEGLTVPVLCN